MSNLAYNIRNTDSKQELRYMTYEELFSNMPDMVGSRDAMAILKVDSIQGVHYIMSHLPEDAPAIQTEDYVIGKRKLILYSKADLIALRRYRDKKET